VAFEGEGVAELRARFLELLGRVGKISVAADELWIGQARGRSWAREAGFEPVRGRRHPRRGEYEQLRAQGVAQRQVGKVLERSAGAVANALDKLVSLGTAEMVTDKPRSYRLAPAASASAAADPGRRRDGCSDRQR
jgi:hypothetical protein